MLCFKSSELASADENDLNSKTLCLWLRHSTLSQPAGDENEISFKL